MIKQTLFSMSMFDWQADGKTESSGSREETKVVSGYFGIYWLVSLPLTAAVLLTWRAWWHREKDRYRKKYPHVNLDSDISPGIPDRLKDLFKKRRKLTDIELPQLSSGDCIIDKTQNRHASTPETQQRGSS